MALVGWLVVVSVVVTALGWVKDTWFFSVGYAVSVVLMLLVTAVVTWPLAAPAVVHLLLLAAWGVRLGVFLLRRERAASYATRADASRTPIPLAARVPIWIMCSLLYPAMVTPAVLAAQAPPPTGGWLALTTGGLVVLALGVVVEALADEQKQRAKASAPHDFVTSGLYGWVRSPNYLGELLVWVGSLAAGAHALTSVGAWVVALLGTGALVVIMLGATKRLERTQAERYGHSDAFRRYARTVPVLLPWVPLYSIAGAPVPEL